MIFSKHLINIEYFYCQNNKYKINKCSRFIKINELFIILDLSVNVSRDYKNNRFITIIMIIIVETMMKKIVIMKK